MSQLTQPSSSSHVRMYKARIAALLTHQFGARLALGRVEIDHHLGAAPGAAKRAGAANAAATAGDQPNFAEAIAHLPEERLGRYPVGRCVALRACATEFHNSLAQQTFRSEKQRRNRPGGEAKAVIDRANSRLNVRNRRREMRSPRSPLMS